MNRYRVTYNKSGTVLRNSEIEVSPADAAKIRNLIDEAQRLRKPFVIGRDWEYQAIPVEDAVDVEADYYTISSSKVAHFFRYREIYHDDEKDIPVGAVTEVVHVREIDKNVPVS